MVEVGVEQISHLCLWWKEATLKMNEVTFEQMSRLCLWCKEATVKMNEVTFEQMSRLCLWCKEATVKMNEVTFEQMSHLCLWCTQVFLSTMRFNRAVVIETFMMYLLYRESTKILTRFLYYIEINDIS